MSSEAISLCQSSIHDFISNLPTQASELCVSAVNNFIEDQVADPKKLEKNIYRIRLNIWQYLDDKSVKTLRSVCTVLRHEMDYEVGLSVFLNSESFQNAWIKSVTLRSCTITQMDSIFQINGLARPEKLQSLSFDADLDIDIDILELMVRKFWNLRHLSVYTEDIVELRDDFKETVSSGISSKLITRLEDQFQLTSIDVKFDTSRWKLKWNVKLKPQVMENAWKLENVVGHFGMSGIARVPCGRDLSRKSLKIATMSIPFIQERDRYAWLKVLQTQNVLTSLTCDLNATHWKEYQPVIKNNKKTLKKLFVLNVSTTPTFRWSDEHPFDWDMFDQCLVLEEITLIADTFMRTISSTKGSTKRMRRYVECVNINSLQTCPVLRSIWIENFKLSKEDLLFLQEPTNVGDKEGRFELCCLKNCLINEEEMEEKQVGRKVGRPRSFECLCFGTISYDDDEVKNYEEFLSPAHFSTQAGDVLYPMDAIDTFRNNCGIQETCEESCSISFGEKLNWAGAIGFTAWLYWCH